MKRQSIPSVPQAERRPVTLTWKMEDSAGMNIAKERFREYLKAGWLAFAVTREDRRVQIFEFDPKVEKIILIPFAEGG